MRPVAVIGGGISGLAAAYYLKQHGIPSLLLERASRLGGVIQTKVVDGCILEAGPDSFLSAKPAALELIRDLGMADQVIGSNDHLRTTYIWKRGRLVPLPDGLMFLIPTRIWPMAASSLLGWGTKIRMGMEWFRRPGRAPMGDRSVADFVMDHYGREAVDYLAEPLLSGVYGGDPSMLSVGSVLPRFVELEAKYGSLTKGVLAARSRAKSSGPAEPIFQTLKGGLESLIDALRGAAGDTVETRHAAAEALRRKDGGYEVRAGGEWVAVQDVVLACPAYEAGALAGALDPELGRLLEAVPYSSSITLALGYRKKDIRKPLKGFGFLVPKKERRRVVACTWVGTKFSYRVPEDKVVVRCFLGGSDDSVMSEPDEVLIAAVRAELGDMLGITAEPIFRELSRWNRAMAQYTVGHGHKMEEVKTRLERLSGLHLAGNAYTGIGIPDCIRMGKEAAERIAKRRG